MLWVQQNLLISSCRLRPSWRCFCRAGECRQQWNILPSKNMNHSNSNEKNRFYSTVCFLLPKRMRLQRGMCLVFDGNCCIYLPSWGLQQQTACALVIRFARLKLQWIRPHSAFDRYWWSTYCAIDSQFETCNGVMIESLHLFSSEMSRLVESHWMKTGFGNSEGCKVYTRCLCLSSLFLFSSFLLSDCQMNVCSFFDLWQLKILTNASSSKPFTYGHLVTSALHFQTSRLLLFVFDERVSDTWSIRGGYHHLRWPGRGYGRVKIDSTSCVWAFIDFTRSHLIPVLRLFHLTLGCQKIVS